MAMDSVNRKVRMKSHLLLLSKVLDDVSTWCSTSTDADFKTISARVEHEGLSFLTITLPAYAEDFEKALDLGYVAPGLFSSFHKDKKSSSLPVLFQGLMCLVFNRCDGVLLDEPSITAIQGIRQICYLFKKLELPCSDARISAAFDKYIECEQSVRLSDSTLSNVRKYDFKRVSDILFRDIFTIVNDKVYHGEIVPKHGPGATADHRKANAKFDNRLWTERLEEFFPAGEFLYSSYRHYFNDIEDRCGPTWLEPDTEIPVRVITVPKTLKTPRIIAIEPTHMQYVQQGLMEVFVEAIERHDILSNFIGFTDQTLNRTMACRGSAQQDLATLDLSEASDRVSNLHVRLLFSRYSYLNGGIQACRSTKANVPGHGIVSLSKFASMGSALTFPVEAMVFLTIVMMGIEKELRTPLTKEVCENLIGKVRVYGDDIIVPVHCVNSVVRELEGFGLKVNGRKSFWTGKFRESCGGDFYSGFDVNIVKARRNLPSNRSHVQEIISAVSLRNQFYFAGYWRTAEYLDNVIKRIIPFPRVHPDSPGLGRHTLLEYETQRMCPHLQRPLVKAFVVDDLSPRSPVSGQGALLKFFLKRGDQPFADRRHLERAGRPLAVSIKPRWVVPY